MKKLLMLLIALSICANGFCWVEWNNQIANDQPTTQTYRGWDSDRGNYEGYKTV